MAGYLFDGLEGEEAGDGDGDELRGLDVEGATGETTDLEGGEGGAVGLESSFLDFLGDEVSSGPSSASIPTLVASLLDAIDPPTLPLPFETVEGRRARIWFTSVFTIPMGEVDVPARNDDERKALTEGRWVELVLTRNAAALSAK